MIAATRRHTSFTTVIAVLALVIAVGGGGQAIAAKAKALAKNVVTSKQVKNETLTSVDIKNGTLTAADVKDGSLSLKDLASGVIPTPPTTLPPSGTAGGDLTGSYPNPTLSAATRAGFQEDYARTIVLHGSGTATENGAALLAAAAAITDASSSKRYLIVLEPATYDIGGAELTLPQSVDMTGAGAHSTKVVGTSDAAGEYTLIADGSRYLSNFEVSRTTSGLAAFTMRMGAGTLDGMSLRAIGTSADATAFETTAGVTIRDSAIAANTTGASFTATGLTMGGAINIHLDSVQVTTLATSNATAYAYRGSGSLTAVGSRLSGKGATGGVGKSLGVLDSGDAKVTASVVVGQLEATATGFIYIAGSEVQASPALTNNPTCIYSWKSDWTPLPGDCDTT